MKRIMKFNLIILFLLITGCHRERVVATVDGMEITYSELKESIGIPPENTQALRDTVLSKLDALIERKLIVKEAIEKGYENLPDVEADIKKVEKGGYLNYARKKEIFDRIKVNSWEMKLGYNYMKKEVKVKVLVVKDKKLADSLLHLILRGSANFDTLITRYSIFARRPEIGPLPLLYVPMEFRSYASKLKPGQYSSVIKYEVNGEPTYWIMQLLERKKRKVREFKFEKREIKSYLEREKYTALYKKFRKRYLTAANLKINEDILSTICSMKPYEIPKNMWDKVVATYRGKTLKVRNAIPLLVKLPDYLDPKIKMRRLKEQIEEDVMYRLIKERYKDDPGFKRYFQKLKENVLYSKYFEKEIRGKIKVDSSEVESYYKEHIKEFTIPERRKLRVIKCSSKERIDSAYAELKKGVEFEEVAKKFSEDPSAGKGGLVGWVRKDDAEKSYLIAGFNLKSGNFSKPYYRDGNWFIVMCEEIYPETVKPLDNVRKIILNRIIFAKTDAKKKEVIEQLKKKYKIEKNMKNIEKLIRELSK